MATTTTPEPSPKIPAANLLELQALRERRIAAVRATMLANANRALQALRLRQAQR